MPTSPRRRKPKKRTPNEGPVVYMVFMSHSSQDAWIARMMAEKIHELGASVGSTKRTWKGVT